MRTEFKKQRFGILQIPRRTHTSSIGEMTTVKATQEPPIYKIQ